MWFKNLSLFRFTEPFALTPAELEKQLENFRSRPCGRLEQFSYGWTAPLGRRGKQWIHSSNGFLMICAAKEEKILPPSVVNEIVSERAAELEEREARRIGKKQREAIREEVIHDLLPRAFSHRQKTYAYIDPQGGWLVIDAASAKKAEELTTLLRKSLGSLSVTPPILQQRPCAIMTHWLSENNVPHDLVIEDECELRAPEEDGGIIRCKREDLGSPEIHTHLAAGKEVIKLALSWNERLTFILDEDLNIKRLRFLDGVQEQAAVIEAEDEAERFDVDFSIMTLELASFFPRLIEFFGGESRQNSQRAVNG